MDATGTNQAEILEKTKEHGKKIDFIGHYIPEIVRHLDLNSLCSQRPPASFSDPPTNGSRRLRIIAFRWLVPASASKEKVLVAYLRCFFREFEGSPWAHLWLSPGNLMWGDRRRVGVLNDLDFAVFLDQRNASGRDNVGTLSFMALQGEIPLDTSGEER